MTQKNTTKILRVFGKKPRASKTSKKFFCFGFNFFSHRSVAETTGLIHLYWDKPPYAHLAVITCSKDDDTIETSEKWIEQNLGELLDLFPTIKDCTQVPKDYLKKGIQAEYKYRIDTTAFKFSKQVIVNLTMNNCLYLYVDKDAPMKRLNNKSIVDVEKVNIEYKKRLAQ